ncbi:MAG: Crp/Fnr family transcriptional regulator [Elusimicrobia bacterium]|nr:Crp/Fnr family transcriptional regulator [Elusimicrobiota bacterium]
MIEKILRKLELLKKFSEKDIRKIEKVAVLKKYPKNSFIFNKNEIGNHFFVVKAGKIKIFSSVGNKTKTLTVIGKNDFFGEMSLLGCGTRSASASAAEDSELYVISRKNFEKYLLKNPELTIKLLYSLADRLSRADKEIESMLFHNILGRLASAILEIKKHNGNCADIKINQTEIAGYLGTTRVPVCRAINALKKSGIISYNCGHLIIKDENRLKSMAGSK